MFRKPVSIAACLGALLYTVNSHAEPTEYRAASSAPSPVAAAPAATPAATRASTAAAEERAVSLNELLEHALEHAPALLLSRAGVAGGQAEVDAASPWLPSDPVVSGSVGRRWTDAGAGVDYSVGVSQELDISGRRATRLRAARSDLTAREAELEAAKWFVHQQVHAAYHRALVARERVGAANRFLRFAERLVRIAQQRFAAGETSPLPVRLAEGEYAQARQAALLASSEYDSVRLDMARASGWTEPALLTPTGALGDPEVPPAAATLIRAARRKQPALRAAQARHQAARAQLIAAERRGWPNLTVGIQYDSEAEPGAGPERVLRGTLSTPLPLWVGSKPQSSRARALVERASAEKASLSATLRARIVQARERANVNARRAALFAAEILPSFETNLELLQKAFELGEIDILEVMVAQERFLRTQQQALQAFSDYFDAWAELEAAVGAELHEPGRHAAGAAARGEP